jgi:hypothetical protein
LLLPSFSRVILHTHKQSLLTVYILRQKPPERIPKRFELFVNSGSFAAERIAISNNGKEINYSEVKNYYPATGDTIKYYKYSGNQWSGPFKLIKQTA